MLNVLDYIRDVHPDVYERTQYKIIEISSSLAALQSSQLNSSATARGHERHVEIINRSIFNWDIYVGAPCYFIALEVFDNFAHDAIRYDPFTEEPLQGLVLIDNAGDFYEFYTKDIDPVADRFLRLRHAACSRPFKHPLSGSRTIRRLRASLPLAANLTVPEYIPTRLMQFFDTLRQCFPLHQLVTSDFHDLPERIAGFSSPVVQTRYQRRTVPVTTPLVLSHFKHPQDYKGALMLSVCFAGPTRLLRHSFSCRLRSYGRHVPRHHRQTHSCDEPQGVPGALGLCGGYEDDHR